MLHNKIDVNIDFMVITSDFDQYKFEKAVVDILRRQFHCEISQINVSARKESLTHESIQYHD